MKSPNSAYAAHQQHHKLTQQRARKRALDGWETRRKNNPHLKHITYDAQTGDYDWKRPNGEHVPIKNFNHNQVELLAPGMTAVDKHLKKDHADLNLHIQGNPMRFHNNVTKRLTGMQTGGYAMSTAVEDPDETPTVIKKYVKHMLNVDEDAWGNYNAINMNLKAMDKPNENFHPTGIMVHELGHIVGPGHHMRFGPHYDNQPGSTAKEIKKFQEAFQWEAPKVDKEGNKDRKKGHIDPEYADIYQWHMRGDHPGAKGTVKHGSRKGLAAVPDLSRYQNYNHYEDFAESFRHSVGMPMTIDSTKYDAKGNLKNPNKNPQQKWFDPIDPKGSRRKYLLDTHLDSASTNSRQYAGDLAAIDTKNKKRAAVEQARKAKARKQRVNHIKKGVTGK